MRKKGEMKVPSTQSLINREKHGMSDTEFIFRLFLRHKGKLERLQPLAYEFAQELHHPLLKTFQHYYFGYYSSKVQNIVNSFRSLNFVDVMTFRKSKHNKLRYHLTDDGFFICIEEGWFRKEWTVK